MKGVVGPVAVITSTPAGALKSNCLGMGCFSRAKLSVGKPTQRGLIRSSGLSDFADQSVLLAGPRRGGCIAKQPVECALVNVVAFAGPLVQMRVIEDRDMTAPIVDQPRSLQAAHHIGDGRTPHPKHHSQEFMGEKEIA